MPQEDKACTANPNQISSSRVPRVSHYPDTIPIAEAPCLAGLATGIPPHTPPGSDQWPNPKTDGSNTNPVTSTEDSKTEVPSADGAHYEELL